MYTCILVIFIVAMSDHHSVRKYLENLSDENLIELGEALGLSYPKLRKMKPLLNEMVAAWLNRQDKVGETTWSTLVKALESVGQKGIANTITEAENLKSCAHESSSK